MSQLARQWSDLLLADLDPSEQPTAAAVATGSLLREPATEEEIQAAERRLGVRLPPSYREFLLVSNGAYADETGVNLVWDEDGDEQPPFESDVVGVGFLPVQDVRWIRDASPEYAAFMAECTEFGGMVPATEDASFMPSRVPFAEGLLVATEKAPGTTVLIPFPGLEEWQLWTHWKEDGTAYVSFRSYLEYEVAGREAWYPSVDEVRALVDGPRATFEARVHRLRCVASEEALPLLIECIEAHRREANAATRALGRIGTPEAVAYLVNDGSSLAAMVLAKVDQTAAADLYARQGDFRRLFDLRDERAVPLAAEALRKSTDPSADWRFTDVAAHILGRRATASMSPPFLTPTPRRSSVMRCPSRLRCTSAAHPKARNTCVSSRPTQTTHGRTPPEVAWSPSRRRARDTPGTPCCDVSRTIEHPSRRIPRPRDRVERGVPWQLQRSARGPRVVGSPSRWQCSCRRPARPHTAPRSEA